MLAHPTRPLAAALLLSLCAGCQCGPPSGVDAGASDGGDGGAVQGGACGVNSVLCDSRCTGIIDDPANCGGCNTQCSGMQVCTGGVCADATRCPEGRTACQGRCVDLKSDSRFCGTCGTSAACPAGQGCVAGACVPAIVLDGGMATCPNGGPALSVITDAGPSCLGALAQVTFRWAMCACNTFTASAPFTTDGFDSTQPGDGGAGAGAGVGSNSTFTATAALDIAGACWVGDAGIGMNITSPGQLRQSVHVGGTASGTASHVGGDAFVAGDVNNFTIDGKLFVPDMTNVGIGVNVAGGTTFGPVSVPPPCDCSPGQLLDVAAIVARGQQQNDNAVIGLDPAALNTGGGGPARLDLPCGRYYLARINRTAPTVLAVHGRAIVYIGSDFQASAPFSVALDSNAGLDVFIGGNLTISADTTFGSTEVPAQTRIYVAGATATLSAASIVAGNFYLPRALLRPSANVSLYGSVFCGSFEESGGFHLHYDRAISRAGSACGVDAGSTGCGSCRDCNNQACIGGTCGACTKDSDCCAPLGCSNGTCVPIIN